MTLLNSDPIFANNGASALLSPQGTEEGELVVSAQELFSRLSSGHKVILLTLTCLVAITMERTLVLMDEPENHLHPPLLSAFVRALSALLIQKTDWLLFLRTRLLFCRKYLKTASGSFTETTQYCVRYDQSEKHSVRMLESS